MGIAIETSKMLTTKAQETQMMADPLRICVTTSGAVAAWSKAH
jgi:hypothetical protein